MWNKGWQPGLTVDIVGEPPCNHPLFSFDHTLHLRSPIFARPALVIQGLVDVTGKYVEMDLL